MVVARWSRHMLNVLIHPVCAGSVTTAPPNPVFVHDRDRELGVFP